VNVEQLDLNLLVALDHLLRERSVSRAARRMGVSQPAMSATMGRLRAVFEDPLFVRAGRRGVVATPRAENLEQPVREAVAAAERVLQHGAGFDPSQAQLRFTMCASDYGGLLVLPKLAAVLRERAPGVEIRVIPAPQRVPLDDFESGRTDLLIGYYPSADGPMLYRQSLLEDDFVLIARNDHPALQHKRLTVKRFAALGHILVAPQGQLLGLSDRLLAERGLERRIALRVPYFQLAPEIVADSDLVSILTRRVATHHAARLPLTIHKLPLNLPTVTIAQLWHKRTHESLPHRWLRSALLECVA
jgi:DNA-binding transcriptional LysR family regulator